MKLYENKKVVLLSKHGKETAKLKIKKGLKRTRVDIGIASEGSFGAHPLIGVPWNVELVVLYDRKDKIEIHGVHESSETNYSHTSVNSYEALKDFAACPVK